MAEYNIFFCVYGNAALYSDHEKKLTPDALQILDGGASSLSDCHISASSQDLRPLHLKKTIRDVMNQVEAESPKGVLDNDTRCSESETASSKSSTSFSRIQTLQRVPTQWKSLFHSWKHKSLRRLATFSAASVPKLRRRSGEKGDDVPHSFVSFDSEFSIFKPSWKTFSISELQEATNNFHPDNVIGKGGYAIVFRGSMADGQLVAIKKLTHGTSEDQIANFLSELGIIVHINHPNTARLIGFCIEGGMHIVFQLSTHGSLDSRLHESEEHLEWHIRHKVAIGVAKGLEYLHENCPRRIIHQDIKSANILLAEDYEAQICDFGLAKWLPDSSNHCTISSFAGTFGYLAPEYLSHGIVNEKTDVFAFGVLLLELITGKRALSSSRESLVIWAAPLLEKKDVKSLVDPSLVDVYDHDQMNRALSAALQCTKHSPALRPKMSEVLLILRGEDRLKKLRQRGYQRALSVEIFDVEAYNATRYLYDLRLYRQVALEL